MRILQTFAIAWLAQIHIHKQPAQRWLSAHRRIYGFYKLLQLLPVRCVTRLYEAAATLCGIFQVLLERYPGFEVLRNLAQIQNN